MSNERPTTILIAEDQAITRFGMKCALEAYPDLSVVAECADGVSAVLQALAVKPNVILMDIGLPKVNGIKAAKQIKDALPGVRIIIFTSSDNDEDIYASLSAGADGYCLKNVAGEHLYSAIKAVTRGVAWLDPGIADRVLRSRSLKQESAQEQKNIDHSNDQTLNENQMMILQLLSQGADLEQVAKKFKLSADAVAQLVNDTIAKLNASAGGHNSISGQHNPFSGDQSETLKPTVLAERYSIDSVLGRGGMGIVYKGRHLLMDRTVAIKMLHPEYAEDELVVKRFHSEAKSLSTLSHRNLVTVYDFGITGGKEPYMVMDYHHGRGLDELIENKSDIDAGRAIDIFYQVCDALSVVHDNGIIHRDIKPSNIVVADDGLVKLVDFGIAKSLNKKQMNLTMTGEVVGTPKYMSPEQCMGKELDPRSDIYSLGCVMYEVFTGRPPFEADTFYEMVRQHVDMPPPQGPFARPRMFLPPALIATILKCLQKDPGKRYQSTNQLQKELAAINFDQAAIA
ncbi:MAG: protein kinase [Cyanobacteria bacterium SZAS TMP-1]|nr:protein kinase [Cyanobacteria bacterium SZAS TMP-1]